MQFVVGRNCQKNGGHYTNNLAEGNGLNEVCFRLGLDKVRG